MGFFRALKSLVSPKAMAEETIDAQFKTFRHFAMEYPDSEPHELLAHVLLARWQARGVDVSKPGILDKSMIDTMPFACLPVPTCIRALGLYVLYKEQPSVIELCPEYGVEYEVLMRPVHEAIKNGTVNELHAQQNPRTADSGQ